MAARAAGAVEEPSDRNAFLDRWRAILADDRIDARTIVRRGEAVGYVARFEQLGRPSISFSIGREHWGQGIGTAAIRGFVVSLAERPLHARVLKHNERSIRALAHAGFEPAGEDLVRLHDGSEAEEVLLQLR